MESLLSYPVSVLLEKIPKIIIDITMTKIKTSISTITLANRDTATISLPAVRSVIVLKYVKSKLMAKALLVSMPLKLYGYIIKRII